MSTHAGNDDPQLDHVLDLLTCLVRGEALPTPPAENNPRLQAIVKVLGDLSARLAGQPPPGHSRDKLAQIFDRMSDGVYIADANYTIHYINPAAQTQFGPLGESKCYEYFHGRDTPCESCNNAAVFSGQSVRWESSHGGRNYEILDTPFEDADGHVLKLQLNRDITERKRMEAALQRVRSELEEKVAERTAVLAKTNAALRERIAEHARTEEALRESEAKYRQLWESMNDAAFIADVESGCIVETNKAGELLLGRSRDEIVGLHHAGLHPPEERSKYIAAFLRHTREGGVVHDAEAYRSDGISVPVAISAAPVEMAGKAYLLGIFHDMTARKEAEHRVQQARDHLQALYDASPDIILLHGRQGRLVDANENAVKAYGFSRDELLSLPFRHRSAVDEGFTEARAMELIERTRAGEALDFEWLAKRKNGERFPVEVRLRRLGGDAHEGEVLAIVRDISDRKRFEQERTMHAVALERKTAHLERANAELQQFSYAVSHDLKAPLRAVSNLVSVMEDDLGEALQSATRGHMRTLQARVQRMDRLINALLDYARTGEACRHQFAIVDTGAVARKLIATRAPAPPFTATVADNMPAFKTDSIHLTRVLANLIHNAIEHHDRPDGRVHVGAYDEGEHYRFTVSDDGPGIAAEFHEKIFDMFEVLDARNVTNTGIGLALCRKLVHNCGGRIWLDSAPGEGAQFHFTWPKAADACRLP